MDKNITEQINQAILDAGSIILNADRTKENVEEKTVCQNDEKEE